MSSQTVAHQPTVAVGAWVSLSQARRLAGFPTSYAVMAAALRGQLGYLAEPGRSLQFSRADAIRIREGRGAP